MRIGISLITVVAALLSASAIQAQPQQYYLTEQLPQPDWYYTEVDDVNNAGDAAGWGYALQYCCDSSYLADQPLLWHHSGRVHFFEGNFSGGHALAINNEGVAAGFDFVPSGFPGNRAALYDIRTGTVTKLGFLFDDQGGSETYSIAEAINDAGLVAGEAYANTNADLHAVMWSHGKIKDLGTLGGTFAQTTAISPAGTIVGSSTTSAAGNIYHAFAYHDGKMVDLGALKGAKGISGAASANDTEIVGDSDGHGVIWKNDRIVTDLGSKFLPRSVNTAGEMVGTSEGRAAIWIKGAPVDLDSLISPIGAKLPPGQALDDATKITDTGLIEAHTYSTRPDTGDLVTTSYLLSPVIQTSISVSSSQSTSFYGQSIRLRATVKPDAGDVPAGHVTFMDGKAVLGSASLDDHGQAHWDSSTLTVGAHPITVRYAGSVPDGPSESAVFTQRVTASTTRTTIQTASSTVTHGQSFKLTATVVPAFGKVTGNVIFKSGDAELGKLPLDPPATQASLHTSFAAPGKYLVTAHYKGNTDFEASTSVPLTLTVK